MAEKKDLTEFGNRLRSARKMAGLSMGDLSKKMGGIITKQSISKYEKGSMNPSSDVLIKLSQALGVKPEYFYRSSKITLSGIEFRKKFKLPSKEVESIEQRTIDFLECYLELENILGIETKFRNPVPNISVNNLEDVENLSLKIREKWNLGLAPIPNFLELLEENGIKVFEIKNIKGFDGLSARIGNFYVMVINKDMPADRIRFTAAHELAHILCKFPDKSHKEKLCHTFAGAFLLPKQILQKELMQKREQITLWELGEFKKTYGISIQAIVRRAHLLGIVSDFYLRNFQSTLDKKNWRITEPVEYQGREEALCFRQLLHYAVSEEIITLSRGAELANMNLTKLQEEVRTAI